MDFQVRRDDLRRTRVVDSAPVELEPGQALLRIDSFGLTSNNVTYGVLGESMSYWDFFPADDGWGRIPVWGFADVAASTTEGLAESTRVFGFLAPSSELVVSPVRVEPHGFFDAAPHRASLPRVYNHYAQVDADPSYNPDREAEAILLRPLFLTSFLLDDLLADEDFFRAEAVIVSSASSKTALAAAFLIARREKVELVGLTSPGNVGFVEGVGIYDEVVEYKAVDLLARRPAVYVDVAGDDAVRAAVHRHHGEQLAHSAIVGATHWEEPASEGDPLPGPAPQFFFAPDRVSARRREWGREGLDARAADAWSGYVEWTSGWLEIVRDRAFEDVERVWLEVLEGRTPPAAGHVLSVD